MRTILFRLGSWAVFTVLIVVAAVWAWHRLDERRRPQRATAERLIAVRLGRMTPEQRRIVDAALARDPIMAALAAHEERGWEGLTRFASRGPDPVLKIQRLAIEAAGREHLDAQEAADFVDAAVTQYVLAAGDQAAAGEEVLRAVEQLSPEEYRNVAADGSYVLVAPLLNAQLRGTFRSNQDVLTPLLAAADPSEWNGLVERFAQAMPRIGEILRGQTEYGASAPMYGMVYLLHHDWVGALQRTGIREREAIEFVGTNAEALRQLNRQPDAVAAQVRSLRDKTTAEDGLAGGEPRTLFQWACADPAVFWVAAHAQTTAGPDEEQQRAAFTGAVTVLQRYAGTDLPAILTKYAADGPALFQAALQGLVLYDNEADPDQAKRSAAAQILNHYQDDEVFKGQLARHGPRLIVAVGAGGPDVLAEVAQNPRAIDNYVTADGRPIEGKPWWTWVPGGNVVYLADKLVDGRPTYTGDWLWAAADLIILRLPGLPVLRFAIRGGSVALERSAVGIVTRAASEAAAETASRWTARVMLREALVLLRGAGIKLGSAASRVAGRTAEFTLAHPWFAVTASGVAVYGALRPEAVSEFLSDPGAFVSSRMQRVAAAWGRAALEIPAAAIKAVWEQAKKMASEEPLLAIFYYPVAVLIVLTVVFLPLLLLRFTLPEVFKLLQGWLVHGLRSIGSKVGHLARPRRRASMAAAGTHRASPRGSSR